MAASRGDIAFVKTLVELGADINRRGGTFGGAPINEAASNGHVNIVRYLLEQKADLDTSEPERNPLFGAIFKGNAEIAELLLSYGIDASIRYSGDSMKNMGAFEFAITRRQRKIADILRAHGVTAQLYIAADASRRG
jgi:uncharacterized protein